MSRIVSLGEVVADIYRDESTSPVEMAFTARPGGAPANVAVVAAKLGAQATFIGRLGDDLFGEFILRALKAVGVDTSAVVRQPPPARTTLAFVEVAEDGDREFTFYRSVPAADELLSPEDVKRETLSGASFVNFGSIPLIKDPVRSATHRFVKLAREMDIPVAFDVNLREHLWESMETARKIIEPMLDLATVVKLGEDEIPPLLGVEDPEEAGQLLLDRGVTLALVSLGAEGSFYATNEFAGRLPAFRVEKVVDATGAGDAFLGAVLVHLAEKKWNEETVREAVQQGMAAGALACTNYGAMRALPTREELERFMAVRR